MSLPKPEVLYKPVKPKAAIAYWKQKCAVTRAEAEKWESSARHRAFYVSGLTRHDQIQTVMRAIGAAIENGETLPRFKARIHDVIQSQGWRGHRIENILRTNVQTAYAAGRYRQMQAVKKERPYWQYVAVGDERTRPAHACLDGKVYHADHEFWSTNYPPNGFRCRCGVISLSHRQLESQGLKPEDKMPGPTIWTDPKSGMEYMVNLPGADKGFDHNPGRDWMAGLSLKQVEPDMFDKPAKWPPLYSKTSVLPIDRIPDRHILPVSPGLLLPAGLAQESYALAFLNEFGIDNLDGYKVLSLPGLGLPLLVNKQLLLDKGKNRLKTTKSQRGKYMKLLAETIKEPYEVWLVPAHLFGRDYPTLRLIRLWQGEDRKIGGFSVFNWAGGKYWSGSTVFEPGHKGEKDLLGYLERQRVGYLISRKK